MEELRQAQDVTESRVAALEDLVQKLSVSAKGGHSVDRKLELGLLQLRETLVALQDEYQKVDGGPDAAGVRERSDSAVLEVKLGEQAYQIEILKAAVRKGDEELRLALTGSEADRKALMAKYAYRLGPSTPAVNV